MGIGVKSDQRIGRPDQQASEILHRHIIDVASRLFTEQGYLPTSIEQIATQAGSGKQTIYRRFGTKQGLFIQAINVWLKPIIERAETQGSSLSDPIEALRETCQNVLSFMLAPEVIALHRIIIAEVHRFPELRDAVMEQCARPLREMLRGKLGSARRAGLIRPGEDHLDQALLASLITGWPTQQLLLGCEPFQTQEERDTYFEAAWQILIAGLGVGVAKVDAV